MEPVIERLVAAATPVRRLPPPAVRAGLWLLLAGGVLGALVLLHGPRDDLAARLGQPAFCLGLVGGLLTGMAAALAAATASLPDRSRLWLLLPLPPAALWVSGIGYGCLAHWVGFEAERVERSELVGCIATLILTSVPLAAAMFRLLRPAAPLRPSGAMLAGALAVAALTATALSLLHEFDASLMILVWNFGAALLVLGVDAAVGRRMLRA